METRKTVQTLNPGDHFTGTARNGTEITLTVAYEGALCTDEYPPVCVRPESVFVTGTRGAASFHRGEIVTVHGNVTTRA